MSVFAAVDVGASGGRVMRGVVDRERIEIEPVHRFTNGVELLDGHLRWRFTELATEVRSGLAMIPEAESIGIDTWAVDYGLLDADGALLAEPVSYRDGRTSSVIDHVHALVPPDELYEINGLQFLSFNTIYQLVADESLHLARHAVLLPDLLAYWLTGELGSELTNASTTGLLDARSLSWSTQVLDRLGLPRDLLPAVEAPGHVRGMTPEGIPVVSVGSHDTASAVAAVPATTEHFAYISSGTWSLVGLELAAPQLTDAARAGNFTNEVGVGGRTRFLRNVGGLWLLQESMRTWRRSDLTDLLTAASALDAGGPLVDVDDPAFVPPDDMPRRIAAAAGHPEMSAPQIVRCIVDSLAAAYARTITEAAALAGRRVDVVHIVGGGSRNELLCQLTADSVGLPVLAGPAEATAYGNTVVQAAAAGVLPSSLDEIRCRLADHLAIRRYDPS